MNICAMMGLVGALATGQAQAVTTGVVDNEAPVVNLATGTRDANSPMIVASATDNVGVVLMQLYVDDQLRASSALGTISHGWTGVTVGKHKIRITATDAANNTGTVTGTVRVK
jgi:hypothetical protein